MIKVSTIAMLMIIAGSANAQSQQDVSGWDSPAGQTVAVPSRNLIVGEGRNETLLSEAGFSKLLKESGDGFGKYPEPPAPLGKEFWRGTLRANYWDALYAGDMTALSKIDQIQGVGPLTVGKTLDLKDDLKLEAAGPIYEIEFWARPTRRNRIIASYFSSKYKGEAKSVTEKVEFQGRSYYGEVPLETRLTSDRWTLYYQYLVLADKRGGIGPLAGLEYFEIDISLATPLLDEKIGKNMDLAAPVLGVAGDYTIGYGFGLWGKLGYSFIDDMKDGTANYSDIEGGLNFKWKQLYAGVSYRDLAFAVESGKKHDDHYLKLNTSQRGVVGSLGINF